MGRVRTLVPGVNAVGRSLSVHKTRRNIFAKKGAAGKKTEKKAVVKTTPASGEPRFYAADDVAKPRFSRKNRHQPTKLRASITPGTVVIVLAGRFRGKRVVCLKQLQPSGLLLVSGPYKVNGVPLRRINQVYVIATSTHVDVSGVDVSKINDDFFKKEAQEKKQKKEGSLSDGFVKT